MNSKVTTVDNRPQYSGPTKKLAMYACAMIFAAAASPAFAIPYEMHMDNVDNLLNWSEMDDAVGDLYDGVGAKQIEVSYTERVNFGNTTFGDPNPQFWQALEYGDYHAAMFADAGGTDVLEVEITGLNGNQVSLKDVTMGRWYPDGLNTNDTDWAVYDGDWNLLMGSNTVMSEFIDYTVDLNTALFETVRFQMGDDNWDNGLIAFTYETDVVGSMDLSINDNHAPTPEITGSGTAASVPEPASIILLLTGLFGLRLTSRKTVKT
jgi:hypothetical protein